MARSARLAELRKYAKACRELGIKHFQLGNGSDMISFELFESAPMRETKSKVASEEERRAKDILTKMRREDIADEARILDPVSFEEGLAFEGDE